MSLLDVHRQSLVTSTALSVYYLPNAVSPLQMIRVLNAAGIRFVLLGCHSIGGWMDEPRASEDVDVLVSARGVRKAVRDLLTAFSHLEEDEGEAFVHLRDRKTRAAAIDVVKPLSELLRTALKKTCEVELEGEKYRIPTLEMALALTFSRMKSLTWGNAKKHMDAHYFIAMVKVNPMIDLTLLAMLGDLVCPDGGVEIVQTVGQASRDETLTL
jgi:hypothetical protein